MKQTPRKYVAIVGLFTLLLARAAFAGEWDGFRNRLLPDPPPITEQAFGYSPTQHAGGLAGGEIGGRVQRSTTPASYAMEIPVCGLNQPLRASGKLAVRHVGGGSGAMVGWFNANSRGWRTPNSLGFRVDGNGDKFWMLFEYGTRSYLTGGGGCFDGERYQTTPTPPFRGDGQPHKWQIDYEPNAPDRPGKLTFQVDDRRYQIDVPVEHKRDGAELNRFGIWNVQIEGAPLELFLDDLVVGDKTFSFDRDPRWVGQGNQARFAERVIRPLHEYGQAAPGNPLSESALGGVIFRDEQPSYFGLQVGPYSLESELFASGRLKLIEAASDSGVYLGWFHAKAKQDNLTAEHEARQPDLLALLIEGPSRVGHYVRPALSLSDRTGRTAEGAEGWPTIRPDGGLHSWQLAYRPSSDGEGGTIQVDFDGATRSFTVSPDERRRGAQFDRFGLFNLQSGGHQVEIYIDALRFQRAE